MSEEKPELESSSARGWTHHGLLAEFIAGESDDALTVRMWFKKHFKDQQPNWALHLSNLSFLMTLIAPNPSPWDYADQPLRKRRAKRVRKLAKQLAVALEDEPRLPVPKLLAMLDDATARGIIKTLRPTAIQGYLGLKHVGMPEAQFRDFPKLRRQAASWSAEAAILAELLPDSPTDLSSMLRRLAEFAEQAPSSIRQDPKPSTGMPDVKAFSRSLSEHFKRTHGGFFDEIVASCLHVYWPQKSEGWGVVEVKNWRRPTKARPKTGST